jgi:hypothetical protein
VEFHIFFKSLSPINVIEVSISIRSNGVVMVLRLSSPFHLVVNFGQNILKQMKLFLDKGPIRVDLRVCFGLASYSACDPM